MHFICRVCMQEKEVTQLKAKLTKMKEDFQYNLKVSTRHGLLAVEAPTDTLN